MYLTAGDEGEKVALLGNDRNREHTPSSWKDQKNSLPTIYWKVFVIVMYCYLHK